MNDIDSIIAELRIPDLPYPAERKAAANEFDWSLLLTQCWKDQVDTTVIELLRGRDDHWSSRQVNAAYLADRIMDVFLRTSGLHYSLVTRVARLRFYLAWLLHREGAAAVVRETPLRQWLDHLIALRGWSGGEGRSARRLLKALDDLVGVVVLALQGDDKALADYVAGWFADDERQTERNSLLQSRLLETERGAARQRSADLRSAHRVAQALDGHQLPEPVLRMIESRWQGLLREVVLKHGLESEPWKRAVRVMDWLIWSMDPALSDGDSQRQRLYQVCEEIPDRAAAVWQENFAEPLPVAVSDPLHQYVVARLRGTPLELTAAGKRPHDPIWLVPAQLPPVVDGHLGQWLVSGEGIDEQRRWLFAYFETSGEILWLNGQGVKQGLESAVAVARALEKAELKPLPEPQPFENVLGNTLSGLSRVLEAQRKQRRLAAERARLQAEALRRKREAAEHEQVAAAEQKAQLIWEERKSQLLLLVDQLQLGGWLEILENDKPLRLKLAVRINASGKLVFVDRLGLNKREINRLEIAEMMLHERARILNKGAEFEDTLSQVVGGIRIGR